LNEEDKLHKVWKKIRQLGKTYIMIGQEEIKAFLEGNDPEEFIVAVEFDYASDFHLQNQRNSW